MHTVPGETGTGLVINMTTSDANNYEQGDWVVHCHHGIGQIEAVEHKRIGDEENTYFRIKTADSVIWMPVDQMDGEQFRPVADETHFQEAVAVLKKPAKRMASNLNTRKARIKRVTTNNVPEETARLIRDLRARRREKKGLNQSERRALRDLTKRFLQEWAVCRGLTMRQARRRLNRQLRRRRTATQERSGTGLKDPVKQETSAFLEALARRDDKWTEWLKKQHS